MTEKALEFVDRVREIASQSKAVFGVDIYAYVVEQGDRKYISIEARLDNFKYEKKITEVAIEMATWEVDRLVQEILKETLHSLQYAKLEKDLALMFEV